MACGLRSDDTTKLKTAILTYFYENPKRGSLFANDYDNFEVLVTSDGKGVEGPMTVVTVLNDPFDDFPWECKRHGKLSMRSSRD